MTGMDGLATAQGVQAPGLHPAPHPVMMSAFPRAEAMKEARSAGINVFPVKCVATSLLFETVIPVMCPGRDPVPSATNVGGLAAGLALLHAEASSW